MCAYSTFFDILQFYIERIFYRFSLKYLDVVHITQPIVIYIVCCIVSIVI